MSTRAAAFFDLDKTVIAKSSVLAFSSQFRGAKLITRRALLRSAYAQAVFLLHGADHDQMERMRAYLSNLCTGWDVATVNEIVTDTIEHVVKPLVYDEALELIESHRESDHEIVLVSSSGAEVVRPIGAMLGIDQVLATEMVVEDGRYTGEIAEYRYNTGKSEAMAVWAAENNCDLGESYAYSDSITDLPMLTAVGHPVVVNPDKGLRTQALENDWPILDFNRPVGLKDRRRVALPALGASAALAGAGIAVYAARRAKN